jgi:hypothetical protein
MAVEKSRIDNDTVRLYDTDTREATVWKENFMSSELIAYEEYHKDGTSKAWDVDKAFGFIPVKGDEK